MKSPSCLVATESPSNYDTTRSLFTTYRPRDARALQAVRADEGDHLELALIDEAKRATSRAFRALEQLAAYQVDEDANHDRNLEISRLLSEAADRWEREPAEVIRLQARRICQRLEGIADEPPEAA